MAIDAELRMPIAVVQVVQLHLLRPVDDVMSHGDSYWLDLSLTPRTPNARLSYHDRWEPHRFERPGKLFVRPPGQPVHARSDVGDQTSIVCQLLPQPLREWLETDMDWNDRRLDESLNVANPTIHNLLLKLGEEARNPGFASAALSEAIAMQIAIEFGRHFAAIVDLPRSGGIAPWRLRIIDERLREVSDAPTLGELAGLCGLSVRQLTRGFRASRGRSIGDHVAQMRIENAKRLLAAGESVKAVAHAMSFATPSSFCFAFRKATGLAPRQYRDSLLRNVH
ncbi:MAG: helix-turn-helix transcriptional regulator [Sphingomonas sp.]